MFILPPNCIVPSATSLTMSPVCPRFLYFISHTPCGRSREASEGLVGVDFGRSVRHCKSCRSNAMGFGPRDTDEGARRDDTRNYAVGGLDHGQEQNRQPVKFAPNEARWHDERPADAVRSPAPASVPNASALSSWCPVSVDDCRR